MAHYELWLHGAEGIRQSPMIVKRENSTVYPIVYLRKPKHISQSEFEDVINRLGLIDKPTHNSCDD